MAVMLVLSVFELPHVGGVVAKHVITIPLLDADKNALFPILVTVAGIVTSSML
jgi:hypothetical protein